MFVHEYCHFVQWNTDDKHWINLEISMGNALDLMWRWLDRELELKEKDSTHIINIVQALELDCERKAVKTIKQYKLPININRYILCAKAYIYFFNYVKRYRSWTSSIPDIMKNPLFTQSLTIDLKGNHRKMLEEFYTYFRASEK